ncbi:MAG: TonB-dependent receptor, partial [Flavobacterium sp.]
YLKQYPVAGVETNIQKSNFIVSVNPSFQILKDDLSIELGAEVTYFSKMKDVYQGIKNEADSDFFIYPKIKASYKVVGDIMIAFAGAEGKLIQNTYADFTGQNKFLSPTLSINPTDQQYDIYAGLRGKFASTLGYNLKASYNSSQNKALFKTNPYLSSPSENYSYGNSFDVVYDNVKTLSFFGELKADINKNIAIGLNAEVSDYNTSYEAEAWNLPTIKATFTTDFNIGKKWYAGTQLYYVGERKDMFTNYQGFTFPDSVQTLDSYFDINAHVGYKPNERFTAFIKGNNLAGQNYNRWLNYPVQGAQVILGGSYKFDF